MRKYAFLVAMSCLALGSRTKAEPVPVGSEFQVNTATFSFQYRPAVAVQDSGRFVVVWGGYSPGAFLDVFGQRFDIDGSPLGTEFRINTYTPGLQSTPDVGFDRQGNFVVVWDSQQQDGSLDGVFGQRFDSAANPIGTEFQVNTETYQQQWYPAVAVEDGGQFVIAWGSAVVYYSDDDYWGIAAQRYDSGGNRLGTEFLVNTTIYGIEDKPSLAFMDSDRFIVAWQDDGQDGSYSGIFAQRFGTDGNPIHAEFQVNTATLGDQSEASVAADPDGNVLITWTGDAAGGSGIFGQRFDRYDTASEANFASIPVRCRGPAVARRRWAAPAAPSS